MLIDIPIKEISRLVEGERAREQRSYCKVRLKSERKSKEFVEQDDRVD